jgi:hypothetical protein
MTRKFDPKNYQSFLFGFLTRYMGTSFFLKKMKHPNGYETTLSVYGESSEVTHCDRVMERSKKYCLLRYINNLVVNKYMTWLSGYDGHKNNYPVRYCYPAQEERFSNRYTTINQVHAESNERDDDNGRERVVVVGSFITATTGTLH